MKKNQRRPVDSNTDSRSGAAATERMPYTMAASYIDFSAGGVWVAFLRHDKQARRNVLHAANDADREEEARLANMVMRGALYERYDAEHQLMVDAQHELQNRPAWMMSAALLAGSMLVREYTGSMRYLHAEIAFSLNDAGKRRFGADSVMAAGTMKKVDTFLKPRKFHDNYEWLWMRTSAPNVPKENGERAMRAMFYFAWEQQGKKFNYSGMSQCLTRPRPTDGKCWYCAEYVMELLKHTPCPYVHEVRSNVVDLDELYGIVTHSPLRDYAARRLAPVQLKKVYGDM